ncbi:uncharacterized protein LOC134237640 [Saccostrea cucullata]|uniref:uncharacterized protein LOC134237640 n=1 Tax=Saccostrea cuccullata TaxID=36930 RepID=UPI002ED53B35
MHFWLFILLFFILISLSKLRLPDGFYRVPSCPTPNNLTAWKERSAALNCTDDLENKDPKKLTNIYNCMPSNYLNETVEFCGRMTAIREGNCPVLNYEHKATTPTGRACSNFTNGCPLKPFFTRETYKRPECLSINLLLRCYYADPKCHRNHIRTTTAVNYFNDENEKGSLSSKDIILIILSAVVIFCLALIKLLIKYRTRMRDVVCKLVHGKRSTIPKDQDDEMGVEEPMLKQKGDQRDDKCSVEHTHEVTNSGDKMGVKEPMLRENGDQRNDRVLWEKREQTQYHHGGTSFKVTVDVEHQEEVEEGKEQNIENKGTENDVQECSITYETEDSKPGKLEVEEGKEQNIENKGTENDVQECSITYETEDSKPGKLEVEEGKEQNIENKGTENDVQECSITYETEDSKPGKLEVEEGKEQNIENKGTENDVQKCSITYETEDSKPGKLEDEEGENQITEHRKTENDVQKSIAYHETEDVENRRVGNSVICLETSKNDPIIMDPGIDENLLDFNSFFYKLVKKIIQKDLAQDFSLLLHDPTEENTVPSKKQFMQWNEKYKFHSNIWRLQLLLKQCSANDLVEDCFEFAKSSPLILTYFDSAPVQDDNRELIKIYTTMDISQETVFCDLKRIRRLLAHRLDLPESEIELHSIKKGSLIFEFSVPKDSVKKFRYEDLLSIWPLKVFKVKTSVWSMRPGRMKWKCNLNIHAILHRSRIQDGVPVQVFAQAIKRELIRNFDLKIYVHKTKCMVWRQPSAHYMTSSEDTPIPSEKEILENMEPSMIKERLKRCFPEFRREIEDLFSPTNHRKQTAKAILKFLREKKGKPFKETLNFVINLYRSKETPICETEDRFDSSVDLLQNIECLLDEIDSSIINETFEEIGDVPSDVVQKCSPGSGRKRKERAKTFYDFVNRNKYHFQIFKRILQSNADF